MEVRNKNIVQIFNINWYFRKLNKKKEILDNKTKIQIIIEKLKFLKIKRNFFKESKIKTDYYRKNRKFKLKFIYFI